MLGGCIASAGALFLAKDAIATRVVEGVLNDAAVVCAPDLDVSWSPVGGTMSAAPTRCQPAVGAVAAVDLPAGAELETSGLTPTSVTASEVVIELRRRPAPPPPQLGGIERLAILAGAAGAMTRLLVHGAELSRRDLPDATLGRVVVMAEGAVLATMDDVLVTSRAGQLDVTARQVRFEGGLATVDGVVMSVTPERGTISGSVDAEVRVLVAQVRQRVAFTISGVGLDGASPSFDFALGQ